MRRAVVILPILALLLAAAGGSELDDLYQGQTIVTGQGEANRLLGFAPCIEDVLVKVSGDPRLAADPRLASIEREAKDYVIAYSYHDRMSGLPIHDEQGTRDRPYDLTVRFDRSKIDAALRALGSAPWVAARPRVAVLIAMRHDPASYLLASDGTRGFGERQSLAAAAERRGLPILLPSEDALAASGVTVEKQPSDAAGLEAAVKALGTEVALAGRLTWEEQALGWATEWSLGEHGRLHRWRVFCPTFDEAFRNALGGAAQILSGRGEPQSS
jgi:uncharacterized protein